MEGVEGAAEEAISAAVRECRVLKSGAEVPGAEVPGEQRCGALPYSSDERSRAITRTA